jgi:hypothetical protein
VNSNHAIFQREWQKMHDGPLRIKVTVEREDGTELYSVYPLTASAHYGDTVEMTMIIGQIELTS